MPPTMLLPLDGSPLAARALPVAAGLAAAGHGRLVIAHVETVAPTDHAPGFDPITVVDSLPSEIVAAEARVYRARPDAVVTVLLDAAREVAADLIVLSTHGRGGLNRWVFGSVADQIIRRAEVPVLLVPPGCESDWIARPPKQLLVSLDGSQLAEAALEPVASLAKQLDAEILLVRALSPMLHARNYGGKMILSCGDFAEVDDAWHYLAAQADRLIANGHKASVWVVGGPPAAAITDAARAEHMDMIALTTHGRGGLGRLLVGSIADGVLRRSPVPILLVRSGQTKGMPVADDLPTGELATACT